MSGITVASGSPGWNSGSGYQSARRGSGGSGTRTPAAFCARRRTCHTRNSASQISLAACNSSTARDTASGSIPGSAGTPALRHRWW